MINTPCNPCGKVFTRAELSLIAELCQEHDVIAITDEIYEQLTFDGHRHVSLGSLPGMADRTITIGGFSKSYSVTGWRLGYAAAPPELLGAMNKIHQYTMLCAPMPSQQAALEAVRGGRGDVEEMVADYRQRGRAFAAGLRSIGLPCATPQGTFYAFPRIAGTGLTSEQFAERLLHEERVAVVPGNAFGACGEGFIRASYASSFEKLEKAIEKMSAFMKAGS